MLERKVLIGDTVYLLHNVSGISVQENGRLVHVESWVNADEMANPVKSPVSRTFLMECDTSEDYSQAYGFIAALPDFAEYTDKLDEVLAILTDEQAEKVSDAFPEWELNTAYIIGDRRRYLNSLYKCLQNHTSQEGYEPNIAVSLWARIGEPGIIPEWEQPGSTNPYMKGDLVRHNGKVWESLVDNNVWEPGTPGTETLWREVQ